jgi:hypothetical protein
MEEVDASTERGRGLQLVSHLADGWGSRPEGAGKTVWFTLALPPPAPAAPGTVPGG